jgi:hypothetical protein
VVTAADFIFGNAMTAGSVIVGMFIVMTCFTLALILYEKSFVRFSVIIFDFILYNPMNMWYNIFGGVDYAKKNYRAAFGMERLEIP